LSWLDAIKGRAQEAKAQAPESKPARPRTRREIKVVWFQTAAPRDGDMGAVESAHYFVADGVVTLCDEAGKSTKLTAPVAEGEDPARIAGRMARQRWAMSNGGNFNRRLNYGPLGLV
jgi:hypothetical protein